MDILSLGAGALIGALVGAGLAWLAATSRNAAIAARLQEREQQVTQLQQGVQDLARAREEVAALTARMDAQAAAFKAAEAQLREAFQALSAEALRANNQTFLDLAQTKLTEFQHAAKVDLDVRQQAIANLVQPIEAGLKRVGEQLTTAERSRAEGMAEIRSHVELMATAQTQLKQETTQLVKALRAPQVRGRWGEIQLRRVVELAGMLDHCDFAEQETGDTGDGLLRPDLIVKLPGGKQIIVDAKAPLAAYLDAVECQEDGQRAVLLQAHARQVRDHMAKLGAKAYWDQFSPSPEFVFMFLPGETFYSAALQADASLLEFGVQSRVIPASPVTLIALLRAVAYGWRQERIAESAEEISRNGAELYRRLRTMAQHLEKVGGALSRATEAYNDAVGSIERSVLPGARRFKDLGAAVGDDISELEPVDVASRRFQAEELLRDPPAPPALPAGAPAALDG
ncbi:MAG TPA: DNA recombination protein RmuC [Gemmatimonadales bacterium]|nr:DNA recombination protein RmuC [Gemmatimonadales bacterium]